MFSKRVYLRKEIREESLHKIVSYLDNQLPEDCEIYPKPFLNGVYPDLLVMYLNYGIHIYEFSDSLPVAHNKLQKIDDVIRSHYCSSIGNVNNPYPPVIWKNVISNSKTHTENIDKVILDFYSEGNNPKKIYTALTRLRLGMNSKCHVYIVNSAKKYIEYGKTWS